MQPIKNIFLAVVRAIPGTNWTVDGVADRLSNNSVVNAAAKSLGQKPQDFVKHLILGSESTSAPQRENRDRLLEYLSWWDRLVKGGDFEDLLASSAGTSFSGLVLKEYGAFFVTACQSKAKYRIDKLQTGVHKIEISAGGDELTFHNGQLVAVNGYGITKPATNGGKRHGHK